MAMFMILNHTHGKMCQLVCEDSEELRCAIADENMQSAISDQRKRGLEALERRFASDKSKINQHENQSNKKSKKNDQNEQEVEVNLRNKKVQINNPNEEAEAEGLKVSHASFATPLSKQRNVKFTGYNIRREPPGVLREDAHPVYLTISEAIHENLIAKPGEDSNKDVVNKVVVDLFQHGDSGFKYTKGRVAMNIDNFVQLDKFVAKDSSSMDARVKALQSHSKRSKQHMTMRQHRKCGSLALPQESHSFSLFKPMHKMWEEYISKVLKAVKEKQLAQVLLEADLHGAFMLVAYSKIISYKGISGIMIRETANTFGLVTEENQFKVVPKKGSVFMFQAGCWKITLHGDNLEERNFADSKAIS